MSAPLFSMLQSFSGFGPSGCHRWSWSNVNADLCSACQFLSGCCMFLWGFLRGGTACLLLYTELRVARCAYGASTAYIVYLHSPCHYPFPSCLGPGFLETFAPSQLSTVVWAFSKLRLHRPVAPPMSIPTLTRDMCRTKLPSWRVTWYI